MVDQQITCSYCCEDLQSMVNPKELPCGHIFCILCLKADANKEDKSHQCVNCRRVHQLIAFDLLPTPKSEDKSGDNTSSKLMCDRCETEPAVGYCVDCAEKRCSRHMEDHDGYFERPHEKVDMTEYIKNQNQYSTAKCLKHKKSRVTMVCSQCYQYSCEQCLKEDPSGAISCPGDNQVARATTSLFGTKKHSAPTLEVARANTFSFGANINQNIEHSYRRQEVVGKTLRDSFQLKKFSIAQKLPEVVRCEKKAWSKMEEIVEGCQKLQKIVAEKSKEQIDLILKQSEDLKEQIQAHEVTITGKAVKFVGELMVKKQKMEDARTYIHNSRTASTYDLINKRLDIDVASECANSIGIEECSWIEPTLKIGTKRKMEMRLEEKEQCQSGVLFASRTSFFPNSPNEGWSTSVKWDSGTAHSDS